MLRILKGKVLVCLLKFEVGLNKIFWVRFLHICLQISQKETKENTNFEELQKINSRIKMITIKL